jgi:hypothetical protein
LETEQTKKKRVYYISYKDKSGSLNFLKLNADNEKDAITIAGCICEDPKDFLSYKDI